MLPSHRKVARTAPFPHRPNRPKARHGVCGAAQTVTRRCVRPTPARRRRLQRPGSGTGTRTRTFTCKCCIESMGCRAVRRTDTASAFRLECRGQAVSTADAERAIFRCRWNQDAGSKRKCRGSAGLLQRNNGVCENCMSLRGALACWLLLWCGPWIVARLIDLSLLVRV